MLRFLTVIIVVAVGFAGGAVLRDVVETTRPAEAAVVAPLASAAAVEPQPTPDALRAELDAQEERLAELLTGAAAEQRLALSLLERRLEAIEASLDQVAGRIDAAFPEPLPEILAIEP